MHHVKAALAILLLLAGAACGHVHVAQPALHPNPAPPPGYVAVCSSMPLLFNAFISYCAPTVAPAVEDRTTVRVKG
jgi:hypothetical protein